MKAKVQVKKKDFRDAIEKMAKIVKSNIAPMRESIAYTLFKLENPYHPVVAYWAVLQKTDHGTPPALSKAISESDIFNVSYMSGYKLLATESMTVSIDGVHSL